MVHIPLAFAPHSVNVNDQEQLLPSFPGLCQEKSQILDIELLNPLRIADPHGKKNVQIFRWVLQ